jgi:hypothetical protein
MKLPGSAVLEIEVRPEAPDRTRVVVTAYFHPAGAPGLLYWYSLTPAHAIIFPGLANAICRRAERALAAEPDIVAS